MTLEAELMLTHKKININLIRGCGDVIDCITNNASDEKSFDNNRRVI